MNFTAQPLFKFLSVRHFHAADLSGFFFKMRGNVAVYVDE